MGWRWRKTVNLGGGARITTTTEGVGVSCGVAGFRLGKSPNGSVWISFSVPGTGINFIKNIIPKSKLPVSQPPKTPAHQNVTSVAMSENQRVLQEIRKKQP